VFENEPQFDLAEFDGCWVGGLEDYSVPVKPSPNKKSLKGKGWGMKKVVCGNKIKESEFLEQPSLI
jgi:hypothetical protein